MMKKRENLFGSHDTCGNAAALQDRWNWRKMKGVGSSTTGNANDEEESCGRAEKA